MILSYRFRLVPTRKQHRALEAILESQRELYNAALQERIEAYRKRGITRTFVDQCMALTELRQSDAESRNLPARLQRTTLKRLDNAYKAYFRRITSGLKAGLPRFKGKGRFHSFGFRAASGYSMEGGRIRFKGMPGSLRVHLHRPIPPGAVLKSCAFRCDVKGWHVYLSMDVPVALPRKGARAVGVDLGLTIFAAFSDGGFIPSLRAARRAERRIRIAQRALARKKRGSRGRLEARDLIRRRHAAVARQRSNHLHQASARLVRDYDVVAVEALNVKGLANSSLAKDVRDASWGRFISMLRYKAEKAGARIIEVDPVHTSQDCSRCGALAATKRGDRWHACHCCGLFLDRDMNAARNILNRAGVGPGLPNVAGSRSMRAGGNLDLNSPLAQAIAEPDRDTTPRI